MGVEVGLESNARKNRGGFLMESLVESKIKDFCNKGDYEYFKQISLKKIIKNSKIEQGLQDRIFDFAIRNLKSKKLKLIETNFYNGGGSKLKAVCGEFEVLFKESKKSGYELIWITDGKGWLSSKLQLKKIFNTGNAIFNLKDLENDALQKLEW